MCYFEEDNNVQHTKTVWRSHSVQVEVNQTSTEETSWRPLLNPQQILSVNAASPIFNSNWNSFEYIEENVKREEGDTDRSRKYI